MKLIKFLFVILPTLIFTQNSLLIDTSKKVFFYDSELRLTDSINASYYKKNILNSHSDVSSLINLYKLDGTIVSKTYISYFNSTFGKKDSIIKNGPQSVYHGNGKKAFLKFFINGNQIGDEFGYNESGVLISEINFSVSGKKVNEKKYYDSGELKLERSLFNDEVEGFETGYFKSGNIKFKRSYLAGMLNGNEIGYYQDGNKKYQKSFRNGKQIKNEVGFNVKQDTIYLKEFSDDSSDLDVVNPSLKKITQFYESGAKKHVSNYNNGHLDGLAEGYYENGNIKYQIPYVKNSKEGTAKHYFKNGKLKSEIPYGSNKVNGVVVNYFDYTDPEIENIIDDINRIKSEQSFKNNLPNGHHIVYYLNRNIQKGEIKEEMTWIDGNKEGSHIFYYKSSLYINPGTIKEKFNYTNNKKEGFHQIFDRDGKKISQVSYFDNVKQSAKQLFYSNGKLKAEESYEGDLLNGEYTEYYISGNIKSKGFYLDDKLKGEFIQYEDSISEPSDKISYLVNYIDNKKHGKEIKYYNSCEPSNETEYYDGLKNGIEYIYYPDYMGVKCQVSFKNGNKFGEEIGFYPGSNVVKYRCNYVKGKIDGVFRNYYENGNLKSEVNYVNDTIPLLTIELGFYEDGITKEYEKKYLENGKYERVDFYLNGDIKSVEKFDEVTLFNGKKSKQKNINNYTEYYDYKKDIIKRTIRYDGDLDDVINGRKPIFYNEEEKYKSGSIRMTRKIKNDLVDGIQYCYYESGNLKTISNYRLGQKDGEEIEYYDYSDKIKKSSVLYASTELDPVTGKNKMKAGAKEGLKTYFKEDGKTINYSELYKNDQKIIRKIALVIGNSNYSIPPMQALRNPVNDAKLIAKTLIEINFDDVILETDINNFEEMNQVIDNFEEKRKNYEVALIYYAGHGIEHSFNNKPENYLLPTAVKITKPGELRYKAVSAQRFLDALDWSRKTLGRKDQSNIFILDACRDNPLESVFDPEMSRTSGVFKGKGLAEITTPQGSLIAFSTKPGQTAADGTGNNSLYTKVLSKKLLEKNVLVNQIFQNVRNEVIAISTKARRGPVQIPVEENQLTGDLVLNEQH